MKKQEQIMPLNYGTAELLLLSLSFLF